MNGKQVPPPPAEDYKQLEYGLEQAQVSWYFAFIRRDPFYPAEIYCWNYRDWRMVTAVPYKQDDLSNAIALLRKPFLKC